MKILVGLVFFSFWLTACGPLTPIAFLFLPAMIHPDHDRFDNRALPTAAVAKTEISTSYFDRFGKGYGPSTHQVSEDAVCETLLPEEIEFREICLRQGFDLIRLTECDYVCTGRVIAEAPSADAGYHELIADPCSTACTGNAEQIIVE